MNPPTNWRSFGRCANEDPELHYPVGNTGPALLQAEQAKNVCRRCTVAQICLEDAMRLEGGAGPQGRYGIRGGLNENERATLYKRRIKQAATLRKQAVTA